MDTLMLPIPEACRVSGIGRTALYEHLSSGNLRSVKVGGRRLVHVDDLRDFVDRLRADGGSAADRDRVLRLLELIDGDGKVDVDEIPAGTTLADLRAAKAARSAGPQEAA